VARIAVVNVPFYSHAEAATRLTGVLVGLGHDVVAWGPEPFRAEIEGCGARFELHDPQIPDDGTATGVIAGVAAFTEQVAGELVTQLHAHQIDVVIHDSRVLWGFVAGEYLGIPRIVSHPMFPVVAPLRLGSGGQPDDGPAVPPEADERFEASWRAIARQWGVEIENRVQVIHSTSETTFTYTTEEVMGDYSLSPGWRCIGPLMRPIEPSVSRADRPLVYACFGTSYNYRTELFRAVIDALAGQPVDVLISTGRGPVTRAELEPLPANVEVRDFVPAREVLSRASVHITHAGCNSVHESLLAGVPMVCIPQAYDQFPLAGRIDQLGAGVHVGEDPAEIRDGVRLLLGSAKARARIRELREHLLHYDGERRVAETVESVLSANDLTTS
jgi:MGT family glycosyltransferase